MEIERINENTIKFYISYIDIEDRGFNREEIWYNRERSEQLFWQVMEEADHKEEDFDIEGPLWIQVQALEKGLEITVTKAQLSKDGQNLELPLESAVGDKQFDDKLEDLLEEKFGQADDLDDDDENEDDRYVHNMVAFDDFEDIIQLSHQFGQHDGVLDQLYHYQDRYLLKLSFDDTVITIDKQDDLMSIIKEYGKGVKEAFPLVEEYGNVIFSENALTQVRQYFN
ncbi:adaptor protein MecA [Amphibacillus sediminis]|uniref:adaptor protein MecA n=1 Tax=Amphibacillus sediminis TaxID=360185 RepID=UPI000832B9D5|nr:adaptor protein MecA [Amphibacillus sediminis]